MTYLRQFPTLPAGFLNTTDTRQVRDEGYLDFAANIEIPWGICVARTTKIGDKFRVVYPTDVNAIIYGFVLKDESVYHEFGRGQTENTYRGTQIVPIIREAQAFNVLTSSTVTGVNDPVYVETAAGVNRGKLKNNNTGNTGILLKAKWLETTTVVGKASIEFTVF